MKKISKSVITKRDLHRAYMAGAEAALEALKIYLKNDIPPSQIPSLLQSSLFEYGAEMEHRYCDN